MKGNVLCDLRYLSDCYCHRVGVRPPGHYLPTGGVSVMSAILVLLAASALLGFSLGLYFSWIAIVVSGFVVAIVSPVVLQNEGFGFLAGIAIIVACLAVNQIA